VTLESFLETLPTASEIPPYFAFLDTCIQQAQYETLRTVFHRVCTDSLLGPRVDAARWVVEYLLSALASTPDEASARLAVELTLTLALEETPRFPYSNHLRRPALASLLAAVQAQETLLMLLATCLDTELAGLLLHESLLRGHPFAATHEADRVVERLRAQKHPLAWLPLTLHACERDFLRYLPQYQERSKEPFIVGATSAQPTPLSRELAQRHVWFKERVDAVRTQRIASAIHNWERESNGKWEARVFRVESLPEPTPFLPRLPLEALHGLSGEVKATRTSLESVLSLLFWAASSGGSYNKGEYAAYGRLRVWESLAGFVGAGLATHLHERVVLARACAWYSVDVKSEWLYQTFWDIFICCLNPIRQEVVLLAATDTD
jgi:Family of unknown function (DUF6183)